MGAYDAGIDLYFLDPHGGGTALYREGGLGAGRQVQVIVSRPDAVTAFGGGALLTEAASFILRASDVASPAGGDTLTLDGVVYILEGEATLDHERQIWTTLARPS